MTKMYEDICKQPKELLRVLDYALSKGQEALECATRIVNEVGHIYVTGIGASWHAGMAVAAFFHARRRAALLFDASELLCSAEVATGSAAIILSRSGKSKEILDLLPKLRDAQAKIIAITNDPESPLALEADVVLEVRAAFDNAVSVTMYTAPAMVGCLLAAGACEGVSGESQTQLANALHSLESLIPAWKEKLETSSWLQPGSHPYFLARGTSVASCNEARLLWEEAAKTGATALTTGGFRHGPQEIIRKGSRYAIWIEKNRMRTQDLELARDLRELGAQVLLIGQDLEEHLADLVLCLPNAPAEWQFLVDVVVIQLAAERLARIAGHDCDSFQICSYIVQDEGGLGLTAKKGQAGR